MLVVPDEDDSWLGSAFAECCCNFLLDVACFVDCYVFYLLL